MNTHKKSKISKKIKISHLKEIIRVFEIIILSFIVFFLVSSSEAQFFSDTDLTITNQTFSFQKDNKFVNLSMSAVINFSETDITNRLACWKEKRGDTWKWGCNITIPDTAQGTFIANNLQELRVNVKTNVPLRKLRDGFDYEVSQTKKSDFITTTRSVHFDFSDIFQVLENSSFSIITGAGNATLIFDLRNIKFVRGQVIVLDPTIAIDDVDSYTSVKNNITTETYPLSHITVNDSSVLFYMPFDVKETSKLNQTFDYTNYSRDGTLNNMSQMAWNSNGAFGGYYNFSGGSDSGNDGGWISMGTGNFPDGMNLTAMAWASTYDNASTKAELIISKHTWSTGRGGFYIGKDSSAPGQMIAAIGNLTARTQLISNLAILPNNIWIHWAITYNGTTLSLYKNGVLDSSIVVTNTFMFDTTNLYIGGAYRTGTTTRGFWNGTIDEVMIFNRSLSAQEISNIYNNQSYRFITPASQVFNNISINQSGSLNAINITTNTTYPQGTNISLRILEYNLTGSNTATSNYINLTAGDNKVYSNFSISNNTYNLSLEFLFLIDKNNSFSPVLRDNIVVDSYQITGGAGDTTPPNVTNPTESPTDPATYLLGQIYQFNATVTDASTIQSVRLEFNGVNYTAQNITASVYNVTVLNLPAGTFNYYWWANDSTGNANNTVTGSYTVNNATGDITLLINGTAGNQTDVFGVKTNASAYTLFGTVNLTKNGMDNNADKGLLVTLGGGDWNFTAFSSGDQNHSSATITRWVHIIRASQSFTPLLNGTNADLTITYPNQFNASFTGANKTGVAIRVNGTLINPSQNYTFGVGGYIVNYSAPTNQNYTGAEYYLNLTINRASSSVFLYLNHTRKESNITEGEIIALNATLQVGEGIIQILRNGTVINSGNSPLYNNTNFTLGGYFNITALYPQTQNYTQSSETWFLNVTYIDREFPIFINYTEDPSNNTVYSLGALYRFNITIQITNGTTGLEFNGVNYSASNLTAIRFNSSILNLGAGTYPYYWWSFGNGSSHRYNISNTQYYTVAKTSQGITPLLNGVNADLSVTYPQQINASYSGTNQTTLTILLNGTFLTAGLNYTFGAGGWLVNYTAPTNQNYTAFVTFLNLTVVQGQGNISLLLNGSASNITIIYPSQINASAFTTCNQVINLTRNGLDVNSFNGLFENLFAGSWNFTATVASNQNCSFATVTRWGHLINGTSIVNTYIDGARANKSINLGLSNNTNFTGLFSVGNGQLRLYVNNSLWNTGNNVVFNITNFTATGIFAVNVTFLGNENWTPDDEVFTLNVVQDITYPKFSNFSDNNASLLDSGIAIFNVTVLSSNGTVFLDINGANRSARNLSAYGYNVSVSLNSGTYAYYWLSWGNGSLNNYNTSAVRYYTVNQSGAVSGGASAGGGGSSPTVAIFSFMNVSYQEPLYKDIEFVINVYTYADQTLIDIDSLNLSIENATYTSNVYKMNTGYHKVFLTYPGSESNVTFTITAKKQTKIIEQTYNVQVSELTTSAKIQEKIKSNVLTGYLKLANLIKSHTVPVIIIITLIISILILLKVLYIIKMKRKRTKDVEK